MRRLVTPAVIREVRHLCQVPPFVKNAQSDPGWSCRTQALILGLVGACLQLPSTVCHGKATFITPSTAVLPGIQFDVNPHAWLVVYGGIDISLSFKGSILADRGWQDDILFMNRLNSGATFVPVANADDAERATIAARSDDSRVAIYDVYRTDVTNSQALIRIGEIGDSPLLCELAAKYSHSIIFAAARHVFESAYGRTASLSSTTRDQAWRQLRTESRRAERWISNRISKTDASR